MLSTLMIALREGLEASLIIGILLGALNKSGRRADFSKIFTGALVAILASFAFAAILTTTSLTLSNRAEELFAGTTSLIAVGLVTWMVFWMKRTARTMRSDLSEKLNLALSPAALIAVAFFAIIREGIETSLFVFATTKSINSTWEPTLGLIIGFAIAIALGVAIYRQSFKIDLARFFNFTSIALVIIAAGVLAYGVGDLEDVIGGVTSSAFDFTTQLGADSVATHLIAGFLGLTPSMTWLQLLVWVGFIGTTLTILLQPKKLQPKKKAPKDSQRARLVA